MAGTYGDMQSRIADEITDAALASQIQNAIQDAIKHYERKKFYFNQKVAGFSTVAGQEYYSSSDLADIATLIEIEAAAIANSGVKSELVAEAFENIDAWQTSLSTGQPRSFAYYGQQIRLFPIPDAAYTVTLAYHYRLATLSAPSDTNAWMTDGEILIRESAKRRLAQDVVKEDGESQRASPLELEELEELLAETRRRRSKNRLHGEIYLFGMTRGGFDINSGSVL